MDKNDIIQKLKENREIFDKYGVKKIGLFGSYAAGAATEESDIDILIELSESNEIYKRIPVIGFNFDIRILF